MPSETPSPTKLYLPTLPMLQADIIGESVKPPVSETAERPIVISARVLFYGMACTLLVALCLAAQMGVLAWSSMEDLQDTREALYASRTNTRQLQLAVERSKAQLALYERWLGLAKDLNRQP